MRYIPALLLLLSFASMSFAWWDASFPYRTQVNVSNSGSNLTDYQVQVNITSAIYDNTGLVGSWHFSEGSGTKAADSSGLGNDGTLINGPAWVSGKSGNGIQFNGVNQYVDAGNGASLQPNGTGGELTIETWVKRNDGNRCEVVSKSTTGNDAYQFVIDIAADDKLAMEINIADSWYYSASAVPNNGNWYHVAVVVKGGSYVNFYINGSFDKSNPTTYQFQQNTVNALIGKSGRWGTTCNGTIDEVRIYNRSLSAQEIAELYNVSKARLDYADLRFALANDTVLSYWLESDKSAWVKMPSLPAGTSTVYMYHGNATAASTSNLTNVFGTSTATSAIPGCTLGQACIVTANQTIVTSGTYGHPYIRIEPGAELRINGSGIIAYFDSIGRFDVSGNLTSTGGGSQSTGISGSGGTGYCGSGQVAPGNGGTYWGTATGGAGGAGTTGPNGGGAGAGGIRGGGGGGGGGNGACGCPAGSAGASYAGGGGYGGSANCGSSSGGGKGAFLSIKTANFQLATTGNINLTAANGRYNEGSGGEGGGGGALLELGAGSLSLYGKILIKAGEGAFGHNQGAGGAGGALAYLNYTNMTGTGQVNATGGSSGSSTWGAAGGGNAMISLPNETLTGAASVSVGGTTSKVFAVPSTEPSASVIGEETLDATAPSVQIQSPTSQTYNTSIVPVNFTATDETSVSCTVRLNGNISQTNCSNYTLTLSNGAYTLNITANDTTGNENSAQVSFTVAVSTEPQSSSSLQISTISGIADGNVTFSFTPAALRIIAGMQEFPQQPMKTSAGVNNVQIITNVTSEGQTAQDGTKVTYTIFSQ